MIVTTITSVATGISLLTSLVYVVLFFAARKGLGFKVFTISTILYAIGVFFLGITLSTIIYVIYLLYTVFRKFKAH